MIMRKDSLYLLPDANIFGTVPDAQADRAVETAIRQTVHKIFEGRGSVPSHDDIETVCVF